MTKEDAEKLVKDLSDDERYDLIMYLAEHFGFQVYKEGEDITFFLSTK